MTDLQLGAFDNTAVQAVRRRGRPMGLNATCLEEGAVNFSTLTATATVYQFSMSVSSCRNVCYQNAMSSMSLASQVNFYFLPSAENSCLHLQKKGAQRETEGKKLH